MTAVRKKACVSWNQCFISCNRNEQQIVSREIVGVQFALDFGMAGTQLTTGRCLHCRALQGLTRWGSKYLAFLESMSHLLLLR